MQKQIIRPLPDISPGCGGLAAIKFEITLPKEQNSNSYGK